MKILAILNMISDSPVAKNKLHVTFLSLTSVKKEIRRNPAIVIYIFATALSGEQKYEGKCGRRRDASLSLASVPGTEITA
ncbi:MAG: hypothetical protein NWE76_04925 [Candidatus Bathyarchaeota archaeon]|nr:hypothetical protein [Candidatus Bathyarchaeota archaeon]